MDENIHNSISIPKPEEADKKTSLMRTLTSLAFFIAIDYWIFKSWLAVGILVAVVLIHESGHFIAMKLFGYKGVNMTFVPFIGAYVSGEMSRFSKKNKLIVLLAGPVPGIIIGAVFWNIYHNSYDHDRILLQVTALFLTINLFNLVPVSPLDGGQFFETLFLSGNRMIQLIFLYVSAAVMVYVVIEFKLYALLFVVLLILVRIGSINLAYKVRSILDERGIRYTCSYTELSDEEYWLIRDVLITESRALGRSYDLAVPSDKETALIPHIKNILQPVYEDSLGVGQKILFLLIWLAAVALPVGEWMYFKEYF